MMQISTCGALWGVRSQVKRYNAERIKIMKQQNNSYLSVGAFVLAMLLGLMVMLVMITGFVWSADYYTVRYENVTGLSRGSPVTFEGCQIGRVSTVNPSHEDGRQA